MRSKFGDLRLDKRLAQLTEQLTTIPVVNLPQALTDIASLKAGYRFMNNPKVTHETLIAIEQEATVQRIEGEVGECLLAIQDTTSFNFSNRAALSGLGVLDDNKTPGFMAHTTLGVSENGVPLGVLGQRVWSRPQKPPGAKDTHKTKPIREKESFKWLQGIRDIAVLADRRIVTICDREADIYELFQEAANQGVDFIVRAAQNRRLEDAPLLRDHLSNLSAAESYSLTVQRQVNQAERVATVEIRYATVILLPPERNREQQAAMPLAPLTLQVVEVREMNPPAEVKSPIHWILLTSLPVENLAEAHRLVRFYTYRWLVERFHYVLKSGGCHFEDSQLRTVEALHRLLGLCSQVAWRLLWLTYQARQTPDAPCTVALSLVEWQALTAFIAHSQTPASTPPTLRQAVREIARLGGFIGRKSDGDPGVKTLWRGWQRLQDIVATWLLFHPPEDVGND